MAFKKSTTSSTVPDSPDRLFLDLPLRKHASLFDHQGQVLRNYVSNALDDSDVALQLPTGSGKTLVGLLLAEWRRRKYKEKIVYLCPTRQLVNQVAEEAASKYGLTVQPFTGKIKDYLPAAKTAYKDGNRIAVTTYNSLFNTNPFFNDADIIIIDDAHAAESYMASLWSFNVSRFNDKDKLLFNAIANVIKQVLSDLDFNRLIGELDDIIDISWIDKIPTMRLQEIADELRIVIGTNIKGTKQQYSWQMISDHLHACQMYVSSSEIVIRPLIPPTWSHEAFENAKQRIFMSATLGAGGDLERLTGRAKIKRLPIPEGWNQQGIGRRFFIFPERVLTPEETTSLRRSLMAKVDRSLVLTPSNDDAEEISNDIVSNLAEFKVFSADDLEVSKSKFINEKKAVAVIANRYDGIDLPGDDCRLLFIEGLSKTTNLQERFLINKMGASLLFNERIQTRVFQAIGRCTRGLNDYSAVVVTGDELGTYLTNTKKRKYFHPELQAELEFGIHQSTDVHTEDIIENFQIFIEHGKDWEEANQEILDKRAKAIREEFPAMNELETTVKFEIEWQKSIWNNDYVAAADAAREVLANLRGADLRGYRALWHYLAGSSASLAFKQGINGMDLIAREQYIKAKKAAVGVTWLINLANDFQITESIEEQKNDFLMKQIEQLEVNLAKLGTVNNWKFSERENLIRKGLSAPETFEQAQVLLGQHIGLFAYKKEVDASPDPWWMIGDIVIVFEDHANATSNLIDATKARQAASHPEWIRSNVPNTNNARILPVLVTPVTTAKSGATPHLKKVSYWGLSDFREWAELVLQVIRELRREFSEPGDLDWRAKAAEELSKIHADASGLYNWLYERTADKFLQEIQ